MSYAKKIYLAVASGLVAAGIVLAGLGFVLSGLNPAVFTATVDGRDGTIVLGGTVVDDPSALPLIEQIADLGQINITAPEAPAAPSAPAASK